MTTEQRILWLSVCALGSWLLYLLSPVLTPFIAAGLLAYIGDPLADRLQRWKLPRALAVMVVFLLTFFVLTGLVLLLLPLVQSQVAALLEALPRYVQILEDKVGPLVAQYIAPGAQNTDSGLTALLEKLGASAGSWGGTIVSSLSRSGGALVAAVVNLLLVPILTFYLLRDYDQIVARIAALIPAEKRVTAMQLGHEVDDTLGAFLRGQLLVMISLGAIYTLGLSLIGLQFALAIGVVAGLVSFVPYLGFVFGISLAGLTAINSPDSGWMMLFVVIVFSVGQFIEGSLLTPKLVGDRIGLHPVLVIFAVMAFAQLFGFFGILLALPAAAIIAVFVRFAYARYLHEHPEAEEFLEENDANA